MAKDDYHAIVYYLLSYLYHCLKIGEKPNEKYLELAAYPAFIPDSYKDFIYIQLAKEGYISGALFGDVGILGKGSETVLKSLHNVQITVTGIEYLQENEKMKKVWAQIKDVGGILFAAIQPFK